MFCEGMFTKGGPDVRVIQRESPRVRAAAFNARHKQGARIVSSIIVAFPQLNCFSDFRRVVPDFLVINNGICKQ
jgi:hypothetical protein